MVKVIRRRRVCRTNSQKTFLARSFCNQGVCFSRNSFLPFGYFECELLNRNLWLSRISLLSSIFNSNDWGIDLERFVRLGFFEINKTRVKAVWGEGVNENLNHEGGAVQWTKNRRQVCDLRMATRISRVALATKVFHGYLENQSTRMSVVVMVTKVSSWLSRWP